MKRIVIDTIKGETYNYFDNDYQLLLVVFNNKNLCRGVIMKKLYTSLLVLSLLLAPQHVRMMIATKIKTALKMSHLKLNKRTRSLMIIQKIKHQIKMIKRILRKVKMIKTIIKTMTKKIQVIMIQQVKIKMIIVEMIQINRIKVQTIQLSNLII